jgi:hypothetical protein
MRSALAGLGLFWYRFIVGDDWTIAVTVFVGLATVFAVRSVGISAWWLLPLLVIAVLGVSLYRARVGQAGAARR